MVNDETVAARLAEIDAVRLWTSPEDAQRAIDWLRTQLDAMRERAEKAELALRGIAVTESYTVELGRERDEARAQLARSEAECYRKALDELSPVVSRTAHERDEAQSQLASLAVAAHAVYREAYGPSRALNDVAPLVDALGARLDALAPIAKARDERVVAAERARADEAAAQLNIAKAHLRDAENRADAERARADAAEARCAMVSEAANALIAQRDEKRLGQRTQGIRNLLDAGCSQSAAEDYLGADPGDPQTAALRTALSASQADVAAWTERVRQEGREAARKELATMAGLAEHGTEGMVAAEQAGYARGIEAAAKVCDVVAEETDARAFRAHTANWVRRGGTICAERIRALSPHPAAPSPAQPVAVGAVEREACIAYAAARRALDSGLDAEEAAVRGIEDVDAGEYRFADLPSALAEHGKVRR